MNEEQEPGLIELNYLREACGPTADDADDYFAQYADFDGFEDVG